MNAIKAGKVVVQNPLYKMNFHEVNLSPEAVEWIVFWSRNYANFLRHKDFFAEYNLFFHFTIVSHNSKLEKKQLDIKRAIRQVQELVKIDGNQRLIWRYDPIVIWREGDRLHCNFNKDDFMLLCEEFNKMGIRCCYFSFVTLYSKVIKRFKSKYPDFVVANHNSELYRTTLLTMQEICAKYDIVLYSCCNDKLVSGEVQKGSCISGSLLNRLSGEKRVSQARAPTRQDCGCTRSIDIGNYIQHPCYFGCIYCYANPVW